MIEADQNPYIYTAAEKNCVPISTITRYLKDDPNSQALHFIPGLNLEESHGAPAAELGWEVNKRHVAEHAVAIHLLAACERNPAAEGETI